MMNGMSRIDEPSVELRHVVIVAGSLADVELVRRRRLARPDRRVRQGRRARRGHVADRPAARPDPPDRRKACRPRSPESARSLQWSIRRPTVASGWSRRSTRCRRDGRAITDANLAEVVNAPAPCRARPGGRRRADNELPTTLVWELAYGELVYVDVPWADSPRRAPRRGHRRVRRSSPTVRGTRLMGSPVYRDSAVVLRTYKLAEADRIVVLHDRAPRQGPRRRQGRAQDDVEVRRPARADEPRATAARPRPHRPRHRQPGRVDRNAGPAGRRPRSPHQRHGDARSRRSVGPGARAGAAPVPHARRRAAHGRPPIRPAGGRRRSTGSCSPPRGSPHCSTSAPRCGEPGPLVALDMDHGGALCRNCRSRRADSAPRRWS